MTMPQTQAESTTKPEIITIGDKTYTVLFPDLVRPLTERERADLKNSILTYGIKNEVVIDKDNGIIDGANRTRIAAELDLPVLPTRMVELSSEEDKRRLALSLNLDRRHLTPEERARLVEARRQRVQKGRCQGKSLRTLADEEGVSHEQIRKDLQPDPGVNPLTPKLASPAPSQSDPEPIGETTMPRATVQGRDGKRYTSRRRKGRLRNAPAKCNIKGLVKPIKELVEQGKVDAHVAERFAAQLDRDRQMQFLAGKDGAAICMALSTWDEERRWIERAACVLPSGTNDAFAAWDAAKASPECRQKVLTRLRHAKDILDGIIARVEALAQHLDALEEQVSSHEARGE